MKNWYKKATSTPSRVYKVFHESFADAFQQMEGIPLSATDALEQWEYYQNTMKELDPEMAEEMRSDFLPDTIYGNGGWHRYLVKGNGDVYFSSLHADRDAIAKAKQLGFQII